MIIKIHEIISNIMDENRNILKTNTSEAYVLYPEEGRVLKNKQSNQLVYAYACVDNYDEISNYEEVEKD